VNPSTTYFIVPQVDSTGLGFLMQVVDFFRGGFWEGVIFEF